MLCSFFIISVEAQNPSGLVPKKKIDQFLIERWSAENDLPSSSLTNVMVSEKGFLWISSYNGIVRFDGFEFKVFDKSNTPALNSNAIYSIFEDQQNRILVCTNGSGVLRLENGKFTKLFDDKEFPSAFETGLVDGEVIWLGSVNDGLYKYENDKVTAVDFPDVMNVSILDIKRDAEGAIWVCTDGKGITRILNGIFTSYREVIGGRNDRFQSIYIDQTGRIWVGSFEGLFYMGKGDLVHVDELKGLLINDILGDIHGNIWIATNNGVVRRNAISHEFEFFNENHGFSGTEFGSLCLDKSNNLWLTSTRDGLFRIGNSSFINFTKNQGLSSDKVSALLEIGDKSTLVGTEDGQIFKIDNGVVSKYKAIKFELPKTRIRDLYIDSQEVLWVSTYSGLLRKSGSSEKLYTTLDGFPTNQIRAVREDRDGNLVIATRNSGIIKWDKRDSIEVLNTERGLKSNFITALTIQENGTILIGGNGGGLSLIDTTGVIKTYGEDEGIPHGVIFSILVDGEHVWFTTSAGFCLLENSKVYTKTTRDGLAVDVFFDILESDSSQFWMTSSLGILSIDKSDLLAFMKDETEEIVFDTYSEKDGLINKECIGAVESLKTSDGRLWFPTLGGLSVLNPQDILVSDVVPSTYLSSFSINDENLDLSSTLVIDSDKNRYTFEFTAPEYISPAKIVFKYILEPYDDDWIIVLGTERKVEYTNLPAGEYSFKVAASNENGDWSNKEGNVEFEILPYWYETAWARVISMALLVIIVYLFYKWRENTAENDKLKLHETIQKRTAEIELQKEEISSQRDTLEENLHSLKQAENVISHQNIELKNSNTHLEKTVAQRTADLKLVVKQLVDTSHEFDQFVYRSAHDLRGPITRLMGLCNLAKLDNDFLIGPLFIEKLEDTTSEMDRLIKRLIALNTLKNKALSIENIDLREILDVVVSAEVRKDAFIKLTLEVDPFSYKSDMELISVLLTNVINNAVRYRTTTTGEHVINVRIKLLPSKDDFEIVVEDSGIGVMVEAKDSIFKMFYKGVNHNKGFGLGLYEVEYIVGRLGGQAGLSSDGTVTTFRAVLPLTITNRNEDIIKEIVQTS